MQRNMRLLGSGARSQKAGRLGEIAGTGPELTNAGRELLPDANPAYEAAVRIRHIMEYSQATLHLTYLTARSRVLVIGDFHG